MDLRLFLIMAWGTLALAGVVMGAVAVRYAQTNRSYAMKHDTNGLQRITTKANLVRVMVLLVAAIDILGLCVQSMLPVLPVAVRQWVATVGLFYLAAAVDLVLLNELVEHRKLRRELDRQIEDEDAKAEEREET